MAAGQQRCNQAHCRTNSNENRPIFPESKDFYCTSNRYLKNVDSYLLAKWLNFKFRNICTARTGRACRSQKSAFLACLARPSLNYLKPGLSRRSRFVSQAQTKEYASFSFRAFESFSKNARTM